MATGSGLIGSIPCATRACRLRSRRPLLATKGLGGRHGHDCLGSGSPATGKRRSSSARYWGHQTICSNPHVSKVRRSPRRLGAIQKEAGRSGSRRCPGQASYCRQYHFAQACERRAHRECLGQISNPSFAFGAVSLHDASVPRCLGASRGGSAACSPAVPLREERAAAAGRRRGRGVSCATPTSGAGRSKGMAWEDWHHGTGISATAVPTDDSHHLPLRTGCAA
jgi:hypothetical protein